MFFTFKVLLFAAFTAVLDAAEDAARGADDAVDGAGFETEEDAPACFCTGSRDVCEAHAAGEANRIRQAAKAAAERSGNFFWTGVWFNSIMNNPAFKLIGLDDTFPAYPFRAFTRGEAAHIPRKALISGIFAFPSRMPISYTAVSFRGSFSYRLKRIGVLGRTSKALFSCSRRAQASSSPL